MDKIDYRKVFKEAYSATATPAVVDVPPMQFLALDRCGDAASLRFQEASGALLAVARTLKSMLKQGPMALDFGVMPLEGVWSADDRASWTLMIMQPPVVRAEHLAEAIACSRTKMKLPIVDEVRLTRLDEGKAVQLLHVGPIAEEGPAVERLHRFAAERGFNLAGERHAIWLSDPRRVEPARRKTILRRPVTRR